MASKRTHDLVATVGKYKVGDEEKKRYATIGSAFTDDEGRLSLKFDTFPVSPEWSGWVSLYPAKEKEERGGGSPAPRRQQPAPTSRPAPAQPDDDDIPF